METGGDSWGDPASRVGVIPNDAGIASDAAWYISAYPGDHHFAIHEGGSGDRLVIATNGNVGIGTTAPSTKLDVAGDAVISGNLTVAGSNVVTSPAVVVTECSAVLSGGTCTAPPCPAGYQDTGLCLSSNGAIGTYSAFAFACVAPVAWCGGVTCNVTAKRVCTK